MEKGNITLKIWAIIILIITFSCTKWKSLAPHINEKGNPIISFPSGKAFNNTNERTTTCKIEYDDTEGVYSATSVYSINGGPMNNVPAISYNRENVILTYTPAIVSCITGIVQIIDKLGANETFSYISRVYPGELETDVEIINYFLTPRTNKIVLVSIDLPITITGGINFIMDARLKYTNNAKTNYFFVHKVGCKDDLNYSNHKKAADITKKYLLIIREYEDTVKKLDKYVKSL